MHLTPHELSACLAPARAFVEGDLEVVGANGSACPNVFQFLWLVILGLLKAREGDLHLYYIYVWNSFMCIPLAVLSAAPVP